MRYLLLFIICLCANCLSSFGQQSLSNPIALGPILVDQPNTEKMVDLCKRYKLDEISSADGYRTFKHDNGTLIKFDVLSDSTGQIPYVEIYTTESRKDIEETIIDAGFHKEKTRYEKGYRVANRFTTCRILGNKNKRVIFTKEKGKINSY